jgi:hypothetical protein
MIYWSDASFAGTNRKFILSYDAQQAEMELLKKHERTGRPLGADSFIEKLELLLKPKTQPSITRTKKER